MYLKFYNFKHKPFQINTDPRFLWLGEKHKEAFSVLRYGLHDKVGLLLLTGDVGTGKTTLINGLLGTLDSDNTHVAFIRDPGFTRLEFFQYTAHSLGLDASIITNKTAFLIHFEKFLLEAYQKQHRVLLIIDEAQRISQEILEEVRLLSNLEKEDNKLLNIFFVGQTEFNDMLLRSENRAIRQRISVHYNLEVLDQEETIKYVQHRLRVSSSEESFGFFSPLGKNRNGHNGLAVRGLKLPELREEIFTMDAIRAVYRFSKGYPRVINTLCDRALLTGFAEATKPITRTHVEECARELEFPGNENSHHHPSAATSHNTEKQLYRNGAESVASPKYSRQPVEDKNAISTDGSDEQMPAPPAEPAATRGAGAAKSLPKENSDGKVAQNTDMSELLQKVEELEQIARKWEENQTATGDQEIAVEPQNTGSRRLLFLKIAFPVVVLISAVLITYGLYVDESFSFLQKFQISQYKPVAQQTPASPAQGKAGSIETERIQNPPASPLPGVDDESTQLLEKTLRFPGDAIFPPESELAALNEAYKHAIANPGLKVSVIYPASRSFEGSENPRLAISRANTVKSYLMGSGLEPSRILVAAENDPSLSGTPDSPHLRGPLQDDHILLYLSE